MDFNIMGYLYNIINKTNLDSGYVVDFDTLILEKTKHTKIKFYLIDNNNKTDTHVYIIITPEDYLNFELAVYDYNIPTQEFTIHYKLTNVDIKTKTVIDVLYYKLLEMDTFLSQAIQHVKKSKEYKEKTGLALLALEDNQNEILKYIGKPNYGKLIDEFLKDKV